MEILQPKNVVLYHEFTSPKKLAKINKQRLASGKHKISLSQHLGYIARDAAVESNKDYFEKLSREQLNEVIKDEGYLTREEAIENHPEFFKNENSEDFVIGAFNGVPFKLSEKQEALAPAIAHLNELEQSGEFNIQSSVISFRKDYSRTLVGKLEQEKLLTDITNAYLSVLSKEEGYTKDNLNIVICAHTNKDHFHLHIDFWEKEKQRPYKKLDPHTFDILKERVSRIVNSQTQPDKYQELLLLNNRYERLNKPIKVPEQLLQKVIAQDSKYFNTITDNELKAEITEFAKDIFHQYGYDSELKTLYLRNSEIYDPVNTKEIVLEKYDRKINQIGNSIVKQANEIRKNLEKSFGVDSNTHERVDINTQDKSLEKQIGVDSNTEEKFLEKFKDLDKPEQEQIKYELSEDLKYLLRENHKYDNSNKIRSRKLIENYSNNKQLSDGIKNEQYSIRDYNVHIKGNSNYNLTIKDDRLSVNLIGQFNEKDYNEALYHCSLINNKHINYMNKDAHQYLLKNNQFNLDLYNNKLIPVENDTNKFYIEGKKGLALSASEDGLKLNRDYLFDNYSKKEANDYIARLKREDQGLIDIVLDRYDSLSTYEYQILEKYNHNFKLLDEISNNKILLNQDSPLRMECLDGTISISEKGAWYETTVKEFDYEIDSKVEAINHVYKLQNNERVGINTSSRLLEPYSYNRELTDRVKYGELYQSQHDPNIFYSSRCEGAIFEMRDNGINYLKEYSFNFNTSENVNYINHVIDSINNAQQLRFQANQQQNNQLLGAALVQLLNNQIVQSNNENEMMQYLNRDVWNLNWYFNGIDDNVLTDTCIEEQKERTRSLMQ